MAVALIQTTGLVWAITSCNTNNTGCSLSRSVQTFFSNEYTIILQVSFYNLKILFLGSLFGHICDWDSLTRSLRLNNILLLKKGGLLSTLQAVGEKIYSLRAAGISAGPHQKSLWEPEPWWRKEQWEGAHLPAHLPTQTHQCSSGLGNQ